MFLIYDKDSYLIKGLCGFEIEEYDNNAIVFIDQSIEEFCNLYNNIDLTDGSHYYKNGEIVCDEDLKNQIATQKRQLLLRERREQECFPIINRGQLWYSLLSDSQLQELKNWYQAWLDVTETEIVPEKPSWLGDE